MPTRKPWNHIIELKEGFVLRKGKILQTSLVYFVAKKNSKRRIVQDYCHVNQWIVKNKYLLSLIADILDRVGKKRYS